MYLRLSIPVLCSEQGPYIPAPPPFHLISECNEANTVGLGNFPSGLDDKTEIWNDVIHHLDPGCWERLLAAGEVRIPRSPMPQYSGKFDDPLV